ncbi:MAG TPA: D-lyxose/D-mannose family sugar isomerase [Candidatus Methylacidiphilales bacterium]
MKRSDINALVRSASACFAASGWALPPRPRWDVTDFGLGDWKASGLVLVNLAEEPEYCEKLMYARRGMVTPAHTHRKKKEDIISRRGVLAVRLWPEPEGKGDVVVRVDGEPRTVPGGGIVELQPGSRVTLVPGVYHAFWPLTDECVIGEVSTANDDVNDNLFVNPDIGRYASVEEDEPALVRLVSDK